MFYFWDKAESEREQVDLLKRQVKALENIAKNIKEIK